MIRVNKKAISSVIIITLLLSLTILSFVYIQKWFELNQDNLEIKVNEKDFKTNLDIIKINGPFLYLNNNFKDNLTISSLKINNEECLTSSVQINKGIVRLEVYRCSLGLNHIVPYDVNLISNYGVIQNTKLLQNPNNSTLIVEFSSQTCDFSLGFKRLYGLSALENAHAEIDNSSSYNVCVKHIFYDITTNNGGENLLYLSHINNSAVWVSKDSPYEEPSQWHDISINAIGASSYSLIINQNQPGGNYSCIGSIDQDDYLGSHISDCNSISLTDKIWLKIE